VLLDRSFTTFMPPSKEESKEEEETIKETRRMEFHIAIYFCG